MMHLQILIVFLIVSHTKITTKAQDNNRDWLTWWHAAYGSRTPEPEPAMPMITETHAWPERQTVARQLPSAVYNGHLLYGGSGAAPTATTSMAGQAPLSSIWSGAPIVVSESDYYAQQRQRQRQQQHPVYATTLQQQQQQQQQDEQQQQQYQQRVEHVNGLWGLGTRTLLTNRNPNINDINAANHDDDDDDVSQRQQPLPPFYNSWYTTTHRSPTMAPPAIRDYSRHFNEYVRKYPTRLRPIYAAAL